MTPEEIDQAALEARLAEEGQAGLLAIAMLIEGLGLPEGSGLEEITAELGRRGIGPDEAIDWLKACEYDPYCFQTEMRYQLRKAEERRKANKTLALTVGFGVIALGAGLWVFVGRD